MNWEWEEAGGRMQERPELRGQDQLALCGSSFLFQLALCTQVGKKSSYFVMASGFSRKIEARL